MLKVSKANVASLKLSSLLGKRYNQLRVPAASRFYSTGIQKEPYQFAELSNKVKIATNPLPGHFSALGVYVNAGSRFEGQDLEGASHVVDKLAYNSTTELSGVEMMTQLESLGGNFMCSSSRESMMYQASVFNNDVEKMLRLMSLTVVSPLLAPQEIEEQKNFAAYEINEIWKKPDLILPELFHIVAYNGKTLGSPLLCPPERLQYIDKSAIDTYRQRFYNPENVTVAFIGVEEAEAFRLTEKYFGDWKSNDTTQKGSTYEPAVYTGGEFTLPPPQANGGLEPEFSYIHLGFEGLSVVDKDIYALAILQTLLGGGGSFSAGGPGKGMYAKLYTQVLNKYGFIENCTAFNHSYADSGLFGISAACIPNAAPYLVEIICQQLALTFQQPSAGRSIRGTNRRGAAVHEGITEIELSRSKNQLKSALLMNLESKMVELEDLGRQIQVHGYKIPLFEMIDKIEQVQLSDIRRVAERVLTGKASASGTGRPTIVIQGDRDSFGDIELQLKSYGLGNFNVEYKPVEEKPTQKKKFGLW